MAGHAAVFLRKPGKVEHRNALAFKMRRHAQQRANGDDAGAADAGDEYVVGRRQLGNDRIGQPGQQLAARRSRGLAFRFAAIDCHKARAEALEATEILVAIGLVDLPLASEIGLQRLDRNAVGFGRTVAAAFADEIVDEHALRRIGIKAALAATALFGRASLVIDHHREALDLAQFALDLIEIVAMAHAGSRREPLNADVFLRLVGNDDDARRPFGGDLPGNQRHRERPIVRLAAGHRDGIVEQDLVGDVDACRPGSADGKQARMKIGPIAQILKDVAFAGERRLPDPRRALAAHLGDERGSPLRDRIGHAVATDARHRAAALRHIGGGVVRATGTEEGRAGELRFGPGCGKAAGRRKTLLQLRDIAAKPREPSDNHAGDHQGIDLARTGQQARALLVKFANQPWPLGAIDDQRGDLLLDQRPFFLDDEDFGGPVDKGQQPGGFDRP